MPAEKKKLLFKPLIKELSPLGHFKTYMTQWLIGE